jgi:assimilatory nitrate reductase catalytic subunit
VLATNDPPARWREFAPQLSFAGAQAAEYVDERKGVLRHAAFAGGRLEACIFLGPDEATGHLGALQALFAADSIDAGARRLLLSGRSIDGIADVGPLVCSCFGVNLAAIRKAIEAGAVDVEAVGRAVQAGTNCGSCRPELRRIVAHETHRIAHPV